MDEVELIRKFRAEISQPDGEQAARARVALMKAIEQERGSSGPPRIATRPRRVLAIALAMIALGASYAVAQETGLFDGDVRELGPDTLQPAPPPASESSPRNRGTGEGDMRELESGSLLPAPPPASESPEKRSKGADVRELDRDSLLPAR